MNNINIHYRVTKYERQGLNAREIEEIKDAFALFDETNEGIIHTHDMTRAMCALGMDVDYPSVYKRIDDHKISNTDSKGMNFEEFLDIVSANMHDKLTKSESNRVFSYLDWDHNGKISWKDLKSACQELGEPLTDFDLTQMIEKADLDRDGEVTQEEFYAIITKASFS